MKVFRWETMSARDPSFKRLFEVIPLNLTRGELKDFLGDYTHLDESLKLKKENFTLDYFYKGYIIPTPSIRVLSDNEIPFETIISLLFPLKISFVPMNFARNICFNTLVRILENLLGKPKTDRGLTFYQKGNALAIICKNDTDKTLGIKVDMFNTHFFPIKKIFEDFVNKKGLFGNIAS